MHTKEEIRFSTPAGDIIGRKKDGVIKATGIPYATARRFQAPSPIAPNSVPFQANRRSPMCPQMPVSFSDKIMGGNPAAHLKTDEDCLHLSVTIPEETSSEKRPVMVWIHGGSYVSGAGDIAIFNPKALVMEQDLIVVAVTYRLGLLGFLGGYSNRPANLGLLDMIEALRWVKKNISAFGGNPENITLFGQSAGGDAVAHLMIAEGTQGLFQNAVVQSAPLGIDRNRRAMQEKMIRVAKNLPTQATIDQILEFQKKSEKAAQGFGLKSGMPFGVQYGYNPLPAENRIREVWKERAGEYNLLIGYARRETSLFLAAIPGIRKLIRIPLLGMLMKILFVRPTTQTVYGKPVKIFARLHKKGGGKSYRYRVDYASSKTEFGAAHTVDLPLLFPDKKAWIKSEIIKGLSWDDVESKGREIRALWGQFAKQGSLPPKGKTPGVISYRRI